jgi:hypothetical protein
MTTATNGTMKLNVTTAKRAFVTEALDLMVRYQDIEPLVRDNKGFQVASSHYRQLEKYVQAATGKLIKVKAGGAGMLLSTDKTHTKSHNNLALVIEADAEFNITEKDKRTIEVLMREWFETKHLYKHGQSGQYTSGSVFKSSSKLSGQELRLPRAGYFFPITQLTAIYVTK